MSTLKNKKINPTSTQPQRTVEQYDIYYLVIVNREYISPKKRLHEKLCAQSDEQNSWPGVIMSKKKKKVKKKTVVLSRCRSPIRVRNTMVGQKVLPVLLLCPCIVERLLVNARRVLR